MKKRITPIATIVLAGILLNACCACRKGSPKLANLETDDWKLIEFQSQAVAEEKSVTLTFDPQKKMIQGNAPCNNFFSNYTLLETGKKSADNIKVGTVGATRKFCLNTEVEDGFTRALPNVTRIKIEGDKLLMLDTTGNLIALLVAVPKTAQ